MADDILPDSTVEHYTTRADWLAARRLGLGASDAAIALGLSTYRTPLDLYLDKAGLREDEPAESEAMRWGSLLEDVIRREFARRHRPVHYAPHVIHRNTTRPWLAASLDGILPDPNIGPGVLEIKTTSAFQGNDWMEEPPVAYQIQVQHALHVTGCTWGIIAVLIGGQRLVLFDIARNETFVAMMLPRLEEFWRRVQAKDPPPIDGSRASGELLRALYPRSEAGLRKVLPQDALHWDHVLTTAKEEIGALEIREAEAKHRLQQMIGPAEIGILPDGSGHYAWKTEPRKSYTVAASSPRVLRRHAPKETA
jgi:putative phage-type endonuclease